MKNILAVVLLLLALSPGCSKTAPEPPARLDVSVETQTVAAGELADTIQSVGTVEPRREAAVSARIMGRILEIRVEEGDRVAAGQTLVVLDAADISAKKAEAGHARDEGRAALMEAEAAKKNAEINYGRMSALYAEKAVSKKELDDMTTQNDMAAAKVEQVKARIAQAEAAIRQADVMLGYSVITSPMGGVVVMKSAHTGEMAAPGMPLVKVVDDKALRLVTTVKESGVSGVKAGDRVEVTVDALGGGALSGTVAEVVPAADPATRSFTVKIDLPRTVGLLPGMFGRAHLPAGMRDAVIVPEAALVDREGVQGVYVVGEDGMIRFQAVKLGAGFDGGREALTGLDGGEVVAVGELSGVREGMRAVTR